MQYSNCGLTNVLYNLSIVSLSLVTIVLIIPKVELDFFDASAHCLDSFALLCIITPKSLSSLLTFNTLPPITYDNSWFPFPMCVTEHFSRLNSICQSCDPVADPWRANPAMAPPSKLAMEFGPLRDRKSNGSIVILLKSNDFGPLP